MIVLIKIEAIGDNTEQVFRLARGILNEALPGVGNIAIGSVKPRHWVAEITGVDNKYKWARKFLIGKKDYSESNSVGSRGIYVLYKLGTEKVYQISSPQSWKSTDKYFCYVDNYGNVIRIDEEDVSECLKKRCLE